MGKTSTGSILACVLGAALLTWLGSGVGQAQPGESVRTVVVVGSATTQGSQAAAAREAAIANSLMNAVALTAIERLSPEGFAMHFKQINELFLDKPDEFIQDFRVLSETVSGKQHRVVVQATVKAKAIGERMAGVGGAGDKTAGASASQMEIIVEGSGNLTNFVKFRKALTGLPGVENLQVRDIKPNETALAVNYRGAAKDLAAALTRLSFDSFVLSVAEAGEGTIRAMMTPK